MRRNNLLGIIALIIVVVLGLSLLRGNGNVPVEPVNPAEPDNTIVDPEPVVEPDPTPVVSVTEDGHYSSKEEVALYIHLYGHLPENYMSKTKARKEGWSSGPLDKIIPGYSIGGSVFTNEEGHLPEKRGRVYYECDIDTVGKKSRGAKRIVFSNDGLVYYTEDHYDSFVLLYGEE